MSVPPGNSPLPPEIGSIPPGAPERPRVKIKLAGEPPFIVYGLMGITCLIFIFQLLSPLPNSAGDLVSLWGEKINSAIIAGQVWRLFTPMLLHGSLMHLGFNMYALFIIGMGLERYYGHGRFLALYVLAGFSGNVMSFLFQSHPSLGASTAIFGLIGAELVFLYQNRKILGASAQRAMWNVLTVLAINFIIGVAPGSNIDLWGHLGGLIGGSLFAWYAGPVLQVQGSYPEFVISDGRKSNDVLRTALSVGLLFTILAVGYIVFSRNQ